MFNLKRQLKIERNPAGSHHGSKRLHGWPGLGSQVRDRSHYRGDGGGPHDMAGHLPSPGRKSLRMLTSWPLVPGGQDSSMVF